ncbi:MAG TPA: cytochrome c oxidase subunit 3 [Acidimicrobiales bacterium]|nr:cytochrome c oxidase subunit 3 [Acidimicrobiales bacterium]
MADTARVPLMPVGTVVWLASELMFFSGLFGAYFALRAASPGEWPPADAELDRLVSGAFTVLLVVSSATVQLGVRALAAGRRRAFRRWLMATVVLAAAFLANQAHEWLTLGFSISSHAFGSAFYVMTGFHGLHVAGGMLAMLVLVGRAANPRFGAAETEAVETVSYYWHFVDVVWVALWATLFVLG